MKILHYLFQFSFNVKYKLDKKNIIPDVLFRLTSIDVILCEMKNYSKLNVLYVYNVTLIEINKNSSEKII